MMWCQKKWIDAFVLTVFMLYYQSDSKAGGVVNSPTQINGSSVVDDGQISLSDNGRALLLSGDWTIDHADSLDDQISALSKQALAQIERIYAQEINAVDTAGAYLINRVMERAGKGELPEGLSDDRVTFIEHVRALTGKQIAAAAGAPRGIAGFVTDRLEMIGKAVYDIADQAKGMLGFLGLVVIVAGRVLMKPWRFRFTSAVRHMDEAGMQAVPIIALITFLVGVVLAYQGAFQLRQFGAEVFVVDLLTLSFLREVGVLLTAIMVAGRSGSAFTAEIGAMKVREEIDAMRTIGLDVVEVLVLPRFFALVLMLPILTFVADFFGMLGGMLMSWVELGVTPEAFLARFEEIADPWHFLTGVIKAPVFALIIALIGCYEGLRVEGSAESVGRLTTRSVVESVFLVIVVDGLFSVFFALIGI